MLNAIRKFYESLYHKKLQPEYEKERLERSKDFLLHKYILFFLNPYKNTRHEVVKKILPSGETYLDIGYLTGASTVAYGALEKFKEVYRVDISAGALKEAAEKRIKTYLVDINYEQLPFPDNFFECIIFVDVIEHLIDPYNIMLEIKRVLKQGGILIIGTANVASLSNRIRILLGHMPRTSFDEGWNGGHLLYFTPIDLRNLLKEYGFEIIGKYATGNLQFRRKLFFNLVGEFIFKCKKYRMLK